MAEMRIDYQCHRGPVLVGSIPPAHLLLKVFALERRYAATLYVAEEYHISSLQPISQYFVQSK